MNKSGYVWISGIFVSMLMLFTSINSALAFTIDGPIDVSTDKETYNPGEPITVITTNIGSTNITIAGPCFEIYNEQEEIVFKACLFSLWDLEPGENETWCWNQKDEQERQVPDGEYTVKGLFTVDNEEINDTASFVIEIDNHPPNLPVIEGTSSGKIGEEYEYTFLLTDADGDDVYYNVSWGDGSYSGWKGPCISGDTVNELHAWSSEGNYEIRAKAKDIYDAESDWVTLEVSMSKNRDLINSQSFILFERILKQYPYMFPMLRYLLGL